MTQSNWRRQPVIIWGSSDFSETFLAQADEEREGKRCSLSLASARLVLLPVVIFTTVLNPSTMSILIAEVQSVLWVWSLMLVMKIISSVSVNLLPEMSLVACTIPLFSWHEEMSPRPPLNNRYQFCPLSEDERMKEGKKMERFLLASLVGLRGNFLLFGNCINFHGHLRLVGLWMWASEVTWVCVCLSHL